MPDTWKQWEGHAVDGKFPLVQYLGGSEHSAVFLTERRQDERVEKAAIKLIPLGPENGELQLSRWQQAAGLSHPNLISLYEMGRCELDGVSLLYVVMEPAEESLAQLLPTRALAPEEARAMVVSVLDVLAYLHGKSFVHGHIKPANILATGDQLKVSSDALLRLWALGRPGDHSPYDAPENTRGVAGVPRTASPSGDVWSLGVTLVKALTQKLPVMRAEQQQDPLVPQTLPEPFLDIARHCLLRDPQNRWTLAQIAARLESRTPVAQVVQPAQVLPAQVEHPQVQPAQVERPQVQPAQVLAVPPPARTLAPAPQAAVHSPRRPVKRSAYVAPVAVGFALVLAVIMTGSALLRHHSATPEPTPAPAASAAQPLVPAAADQAAPSPQEPSNNLSNNLSNKAPERSVAEEEPSSKAPAPVPALIHPGAIKEGETDAVAKVRVGDVVHGEVAKQVAPEVLQSARDSIQGTVRVIVAVNVDRLGNVEEADVRSPGPSKYFAQAALQAAKLWKFTPPRVGNRGVLSNWTLRFDFTRDSTHVFPVQEMP